MHVADTHWVVELVTQIHVNHVARTRPSRHKATLRHSWMIWELISINRIRESISSVVWRHTIRRHDLVLLLLHLTEKERGCSWVAVGTTSAIKHRVNLLVCGPHVGQLLLVWLIYNLNWHLLPSLNCRLRATWSCSCLAAI